MSDYACRIKYKPTIERIKQYKITKYPNYTVKDRSFIDATFAPSQEDNFKIKEGFIKSKPWIKHVSVSNNL